MKEQTVVRALSALAHASRLKVFRVLVVAGPAGATPGAIAKRVRVAPATLSFHLRDLVDAGLVSRERDGRNLIYRADYAAMNALLAYMTKNCCQGAACGGGPATAGGP